MKKKNARKRAHSAPYDQSPVASATEMTGLVAAPPQSDAAREEIEKLYTIEPENQT